MRAGRIAEPRSTSTAGQREAAFFAAESEARDSADLEQAEEVESLAFADAT